MKFLKKTIFYALLILFIAIAIAYYLGYKPNLITRYFYQENKVDSNLIDTNSLSFKSIIPNKIINSDVKKNIEKIEKEAETTIREDVEPLPLNVFEKIDKHAYNCSAKDASNLDQLANYLQNIAKTDIEKARSIYIWITKNISYDADDYNNNLNGDYSAEGVFKSKKSVCEGFSNLYLALGKLMHLEIIKVSGYAKGYSYQGKFLKTNHAWNLIKIDGQWRVFDATWGEGFGTNVNGKLVSTKEFNEFWFNVDPYAAIFSHLPENRKMQHVYPLLDLKTFERLQKTETDYFELGFDPSSIYTKMFQNNNLRLPKCYHMHTYIKAKNVPVFGNLRSKGTYSFEFYAPRATSMAIKDAQNNWTYFERNKGVFTLNYVANTPGILDINIQTKDGGDGYFTKLVYTVN